MESRHYGTSGLKDPVSLTHGEIEPLEIQSKDRGHAVPAWKQTLGTSKTQSGREQSCQIHHDVLIVSIMDTAYLKTDPQFHTQEFTQRDNQTSAQ